MTILLTLNQLGNNIFIECVWQAIMAMSSKNPQKNFVVLPWKKILYIFSLIIFFLSSFSSRSNHLQLWWPWLLLFWRCRSTFRRQSRLVRSKKHLPRILYGLGINWDTLRKWSYWRTYQWRYENVTYLYIVF